MQVKKQELEADMEQQTGSKLRKKYVNAIYCHCAYLTYMQGTSCEILGWMKRKLESRLLEGISITSNTQMTTTLMEEGKEELKILLMKVKEDSEKAGLKLNIQKKPRSCHLVPSLHGEKIETVTDFIFLCSKITIHYLSSVMSDSL